MWFPLILLGLPIVEIALFIQVGAWLGLFPTLMLVILSALAGLIVIRTQGGQALFALRRSLETGGDPAGPLAHGAMILVGGILLLIPGFLTDAIGIALLLPPVRNWLIQRGAARMTVRATNFRPGSRPARPDVIDAEFEVLEDGTPPRRGKSGWTRPDA